VLAFASVYVIWGSTYLAIRIAIETIPPFLMAGIRFVVAGGLLLVWARLRGTPWPSRIEARNAAVAGGLLLLLGNGAVVWAEQWVASGLVALLVATVPLWMVLLDWLAAGGERPGPGLFFGLVWGLAGVVLLVSGEGFGGGEGPQLLGGLVVLGGAFGWAAGSIYARAARMPSSPRMATAVEMMVGGVLLLLMSRLAGEPFALTGSSVRSALALVYLIVFGALVAFSAYIWLLGQVSAAAVSTYAYVNPVVALLLGWALMGEPLSPRTFIAAGIILSAVMMITVRRTPDGRVAGRLARAGMTRGGVPCSSRFARVSYAAQRGRHPSGMQHEKRGTHVVLPGLRRHFGRATPRGRSGLHRVSDHLRREPGQGRALSIHRVGAHGVPDAAGALQGHGPSG
jgi:drug/metabolite transporter (DMT)-like permease